MVMDPTGDREGHALAGTCMMHALQCCMLVTGLVDMRTDIQAGCSRPKFSGHPSSSADPFEIGKAISFETCVEKVTVPQVCPCFLSFSCLASFPLGS